MTSSRSDDPSSPLDLRTIEELRALDEQGEPFLAELVNDFIEQSSRELEQIAEALRGGDLAEAGRLAHGLAGAAHTVGARRLGHAARDLEDAAMEGATTAAPGRLEELQREHATAVAALRDLP